MTIKDNINESLKESMLNKEKNKVSTLRLVIAALKDREILERSKDNQSNITDQIVYDVLNKMIKQRRESAEIYMNNGRKELSEKEEEEIKIIQAFMPNQLSEKELTVIIKELINQTNAKTLKDMGNIMSKLKNEYSGKVDFSVAGKLVRDLLQ